MAELNFIGLDKEKAQKTAGELDKLLANFQLFYQNLRGLHWNVKGKQFFALHEKYEELYDHTAETIDEIAERVLTLGFTPQHSYEDYLKTATIKPELNVAGGEEGVKVVLNNMTTLLEGARNVKEAAGEAEDGGTEGLADDIIGELEKTTWMLNAWLS